ncbi:hypothetical protein D3C87_1620170 [compost metagenome]
MDPQQKNFANAEGYSIGVNGSFAQADAYFGDMFGHGAAMVAVFGWGREPAGSAFAVSHSPTSPFVQVLKVGHLEMISMVSDGTMQVK